MNFIVRWEIEIEADSAPEAASEALRIQRDRESIATIYNVVDEEGNSALIDVSEDHPLSEFGT